MCHGSERFGALDVYRDTPGALSPADMEAAQTLADVVAALLLNAQARETALAVSDRFHYNAMHDPLTGLPNRLLLQERLESAATRAQRSHTYTAVLFLDLDRFKQVNDGYGHQVGDQLLCAVAHRLTTLVLRRSDTLCRFSGDEFVFLCEELSSVNDVSTLVRRIDEAFVEPYDLDGIEIIVGASVGRAYVGPGEAITPDLLRRADLDMYRAKRSDPVVRGPGSTAEVVQVGRSGSNLDDQQLEDDLRCALDDGHLDVAYQPIVRCSDGRITGVEALLRWTHPHRGTVPPIVVIAIAERSDLINELGAWVLERACEDHARWTKQHDSLPSLDLAVNVSVRQLMMPDFASVVSSVLGRTRVDSRSLILELTESITMEHGAQTTQLLSGLTELGVRLALDDFGTGFSALNHLGRLPIDIVKIDRSFISELDRPAGRIVVASVTALAQDLGIAVIAEGVETERQRVECIGAGCDYTQGYLHGRPTTAERISELLAG